MSRSTTRKLRVKTKPAATAAMPVPAGNLWLHELSSGIFGNTRLVRVWLPPDYDGWGATRYPVLYLNDGQNLFDPATAFAGVHWQVGEAATQLIAEQKIRPLIIVGIDNTKNRAQEYIPYKSKDPRVLNAKGKCYPDFLQHEVMPLIEERYPVLKGAENTGLGGSSLGGLITLVHATGSAGSVWAIADREPVSVCGEPKNSGREPSISQLACAHVPGDGNEGSGTCGKGRKGCWRRPRTGSHSAQGWLGRSTAEGAHRRSRFTH